LVLVDTRERKYPEHRAREYPHEVALVVPLEAERPAFAELPAHPIRGLAVAVVVPRAAEQQALVAEQ